MREIYHRATRVILYTGRDWRAHYLVSLMFEILLAQFRYGSAYSSQEIFPLEENSPRWRAMYEFFSNLYFTRIWIVQEIAVGQKVQLYYGGHYIDWTSLLRVFQAVLGPNRSHRFFEYGAPENHIWSPAPVVNNFGIMCLLRPDFEREYCAQDDNIWDRMSLETILFATTTFQATDPRDMIVGLIGLVPDVKSEARLKPNYNQSVEQVYEEATRFTMFQADGQSSIHLLALAGIGFTDSRLALPSWVPDFTELRLGIGYTDLLAPKRFSASGVSSPNISAEPEPKQITIQGVVVDKVIALNASGPYTVDAELGAIVDALRLSHEAFRFFKSVIDICEAHAWKWPIILRERL